MTNLGSGYLLSGGVLVLMCTRLARLTVSLAEVAVAQDWCHAVPGPNIPQPDQHQPGLGRGM